MRRKRVIDSLVAGILARRLALNLVQSNELSGICSLLTSARCDIRMLHVDREDLSRRTG